MITGSLLAIATLVGITVLCLVVYKDILAPSVVLCTSWTVAFIIIYSIEQKHEYVFSYATILIVLFGILSFVTASLSHHLWARSPIRSGASPFVRASNIRLVVAATFGLCLCLPFVINKALILAHNEFSNSFLANLRFSLNYASTGEGYGWLKYLFPPSIMVGALWIQYHRYIEPTKRHRVLFLLAVAQALIVLLLTTGRTGILFFVVLILVSTSRTASQKRIIIRVATGLGFLLVVFSVLAIQLNKGFEINNKSTWRFGSGVRYMITTYWGGGLIHFADEVSDGSRYEMGRLTFRTGYAVADQVFEDVDVPSLIQPEGNNRFVRGNVYTAYYHYYEDWGTIGVIVVMLCLGFISNIVYVRYRRGNSSAVIGYSILFYALLMQPFQEQLFTLASYWIQMSFWYCVLRPNPSRQT